MPFFDAEELNRDESIIDFAICLYNSTHIPEELETHPYHTLHSFVVIVDESMS